MSQTPSPFPVFLSEHAPLWLVVHALGAAALLGSAAHVAVMSLRSGRSAPTATNGRHASWLAGLLLFTTLTGMLLYPHFRVNVRAAFLDEQAPWATRLFELKEHLAVFVLPLSLSFWALSRQRAAPRVREWMAISLALAVSFLFVAGVLIANVRGV